MMKDDPEAFVQKVLKDIERKYAESGYEEIYSAYEEWEEQIPMRDGIGLRTFIYKPRPLEAEGQTKAEKIRQVYPVILQRTCYPFWDKTMKKHGELLAKRGYVYIYQYCRGQNGSEGTWTPNIHERNDGIDTIQWISEKPWAGRIGVWGESYGALIGWAMADAVKGKVAAMCLGVYGTDRFVSAYQKHSFRHDILTSWTMENAGFPIAADYLTSCRYMPQEKVDEVLWGRQIPWYRDYILNANVTDEYWQSGWWKQLREIPEKTEIPLYITSGWYDHHHGSSMVTWERLHETAKKHSWLEIGGWNHFGIPCLENQTVENAGKNDVKNMLEWFALTLQQGELPEGRVRLYEIGSDSWRQYQSLEEIKTRECSYYFGAEREDSGARSRGALYTRQPLQLSRLSYCYDPAEPVMSHGGESLLHTMEEVGSLKQPKPDWRKDVVSFVSEPAVEDQRLWGKIRVQLWVESDCEDTAFTARVMEVREDGEAYHIRSSITTIAADREKQKGTKAEAYVPGTPVQVEIEMWDIFYTIKAGSRLRVDISSSDFPQYNIHSNYPGNWAQQEKTRKAEQTILCGGEYPSRLLLPVCIVNS